MLRKVPMHYKKEGLAVAPKVLVHLNLPYGMVFGHE